MLLITFCHFFCNYNFNFRLDKKHHLNNFLDLEYKLLSCFNANVKHSNI